MKTFQGVQRHRLFFKNLFQNLSFCMYFFCLNIDHFLNSLSQLPFSYLTEEKYTSYPSKTWFIDDCLRWYATIWRKLEKHFAQLKKSDTKYYLLYDYVYIKVPEKVNLYSQKAKQWLLGPGVRSNDWRHKDMSENLGHDGNVLKLYCDVGCTTL